MAFTLLLSIVSFWCTVNDLIDRNVFSPESIRSCCHVDKRLVIGTDKSRIYTLDLDSLELSKPITIDPGRLYPNPLWNTIHSLAKLPNSRIACSYFDEIIVYDFKRQTLGQRVKRDRAELCLYCTDKFLIGVDWNSQLLAYDPMTLEKKYQGDLGRDKSWLINEVGDVTDICFDAASKKIIVARNKASQTAIVDVSNIVQITRPFQSEEHKYVHHCFLKDGQLYEVAKILGGYEISRLDLDKVAINKQFRLATGDSLISMVPISSGAIAGLFTNRNRDLVQLRLFDDGISEKTTFDLHLDIPIQLWPLPDGRLVVEGVDGIEMISFEGYKAKKQTVIRLPYPVKRKKHEPTPVFGPSR